MERASERDRSSRHDGRRDRDREASRNHHSDRHRKRDQDHMERHHHNRPGSGKNSDESRHRDDDRRHRDRDLSVSDTEPESDLRRQRSSSRTRGSSDRERSEERRYHEEDLEKSRKRARVSDGERERRRFEDRASEDLNVDDTEEKRDVKSSTDGKSTSIAAKSVSLSFDAIAKAKRLLQMQKEWSEKLKKIPGMTNIDNIEAVKRAQELAVSQKPSKAPVLLLDAQGREIDEHGNVVNMPKLTNLSTLKVNINKRKKEAFQIIRPDLDALADSDPHFDDRMGINKTKLLRPKRMTFQFVDEGKWSKQAEIIKFKSLFGEAQAKELKMKQTQLAQAKAEPESNPNLIAVGVRIKKEKQNDAIPEIEWWDKPTLPIGSYGDDMEEKLNLEKITIYVEHPLPIEPPAEPAPPPPQPLKLTKKEQNKLRTQRRLAKERERQEMIRQGLLEPPKPKVKMSNLMKVLGSEATQDPTKLEMEIRSAAAEREQAHVDRNIARKLTPAERREKKEKKLFEDPNALETAVSVYKIKDLSHPQTRFKVDMNAQQNRLTGCAVISDGMSVVVVEGGKKPTKRYEKLMLRRINWATAVNDEEEGAEDADGPANSCVLVWQGSVAKPSFNRFLVHQCRSDAAARKVFADAGVPHYWDLAILMKLIYMHFSFFLFCGYIGVSLLSPVMHNLWIWRGTGNANFYFATGLAYACLQTVLIVESVSSMLKHDRKLRKMVEA